MLRAVERIGFRILVPIRSRANLLRAVLFSCSFVRTMAVEPGPKVLAVVLHWCREEETASCVESLLASTHPALDVLVVDNGSPDGSGARLRRRFPDVAFLRTEANLGYASGNNRGIRRAHGDGYPYVLIINDDAEVEPEAVETMLGLAETREKVGAVSPKILFRDRPDRIWFGGGRFSRIRAVGIHMGEDGTDPGGQQPRRITFVTGCCFLAPTSALAEMNGFEDDFFAYVEDADLSLRLRESGYDLWYEPRARVLHSIPSDHPEPSPLQIELRDRNRRRLVRRRYPWPHRLAFWAFFYPSRLAHLVRYLSRGDLSRVQAIWRGMTTR